jgi:phospholipid N-methyltransferase
VIAELLPKNARYLGVELDERFHSQLTKRFPSLSFHRGSAADIRTILADRGLPKPSRIVCGLPFASLPSAVQDGVVDGITWSLHGHDADFRTFQYVHAYGMRAAKRFRGLMEERFSGFERIGPIVRNVPPAYVLRYWHARG